MRTLALSLSWCLLTVNASCSPAATLPATLPAAAAPATAADLLKDGMAAQRSGKVDTALRLYQSCLDLDPRSAACHWEMGWSFWTKSDWDQVVTHWEQVKALDPQHPEVDKHLPSAKAQRDAKAAVTKALAEAPSTVRPPVATGKTVRIRAVGDLMIGSDFPEPMFPPDDAAHIFDGVADWLRDADVTFGNLEGPLCDGGTTNKCKEGQNCYAFRTPTRMVSLYDAAGFDLLSTANNHAEDFGVECRMQTEEALAKAGIAFSGRPGTTATVEAAGFKIGMIGFHTSKNSHYVNDHEAAAALVKAMKASHDLVIVSFHGGAEGSKAEHVPDAMEIFYSEERGHLRQFARAVIGAGADLVLGHGPHVLRGMEVVDGHLVVYSLGNFATFGRFNLTGPLGLSAVVEVTLDHEGKFVAGKVLPVKQVGDGIPEKDAASEAVGKFRTLSEADFGAGAPVFGQHGTFAPRVR